MIAAPAPGHAFGLDAIRACAVTSVLLAHGSLFYTTGFPEARYLLVIFGVLGVEIFFALSGFLVGRQLLLVAEGRATAWRFLVRRWVRTLPNYYLFLAINAALAWWVIDRQGPDWRFVWFAQELAWPATSQFFPESWSLAVEEWFYLLAALAFAGAAAMRATPRALGWGLLLLLVAGPVVRLLVQEFHPIPIDAGVRKMSLLRLDSLAYGLAAAWLERYRPAAFERAKGLDVRIVAIVLAIASVALLARWSVNLAVFDVARDHGARLHAAVLFSALPLAAAMLLPFLSSWQRQGTRAVRGIGAIAAWSYSIYLVHFPLLLVLLQWWPVAPDRTAMLVLRTAFWLAGTLVLSSLVYERFEGPLLARRPPLAPQTRT